MGIADLANRHLRELSEDSDSGSSSHRGSLQEHDLLLLDEPLTGLDLGSAKAIDDVLHEEQASGRTVVLTSPTSTRPPRGLGGPAGRERGCVQASANGATADHLATAYGAILLHEGGGFILRSAHRPVPGRHEHGLRTGDVP